MMNRKPSGKNHKKRNFKGKPPRGKVNVKGRGGSLRPTLVLKGHVMISQNITAVNLKQINIAPTLSIFPAAANQAKFY